MNRLKRKKDNENLVAARKAITDNDILSSLEYQLCVASTVVISDLDNIENYKYRNIRLYTEGVLRKMLEIYPAGFDFLNIDVIDDWSRAYIDSVLIDADINNLENTVFNIKQYDKNKMLLNESYSKFINMKTIKKISESGDKIGTVLKELKEDICFVLKESLSSECREYDVESDSKFVLFMFIVFASIYEYQKEYGYGDGLDAGERSKFWIAVQKLGTSEDFKIFERTLRVIYHKELEFFKEKRKDIYIREIFSEI